MKYIITGSLGHISLPVTQQLIAAGHDVTVISSGQSKKAEIEALGARAAIGSVSDVAFLAATFKDADVAYLMVPSSFAIPDYAKFQHEVVDNYISALEGSNISKVVLLSSIGAHLRQGAGPIDALGYLEERLLTLPQITSKFLRPSYFYYNLFSQAGLLKTAGILGSNFGGTGEKLVLVHTDDIARVAIKYLLNPEFESGSVAYISSGEHDPSEIATVLSTAVGKDGAPWVTFTDEEAYGGMVAGGLSEGFAALYTTMGKALRDGRMQEDYWKNQPERGKVTLEDFAKEFASVYQAS